MLRWLLALIVLAGVALGLLLGVLNAQAVTLDLGLIRWEASLGAIVAASTGTGLLIGLLIGAFLVRIGRGRRESNASLPTTNG